MPVVLGLNWRRGTKEGAIWSMVAGFAGCLVWTFTLQRSFASHGIDSVEVGVALSALTFVVVSRADAADARPRTCGYSSTKLTEPGTWHGGANVFEPSCS